MRQKRLHFKMRLDVSGQGVLPNNDIFSNALSAKRKDFMTFCWKQWLHHPFLYKEIINKPLPFSRLSQVHFPKNNEVRMLHYLKASKNWQIFPIEREKVDVIWKLLSTIFWGVFLKLLCKITTRPRFMSLAFLLLFETR